MEVLGHTHSVGSQWVVTETELMNQPLLLLALRSDPVRPGPGPVPAHRQGSGSADFPLSREAPPPLSPGIPTSFSASRRSLLAAAQN